MSFIEGWNDFGKFQQIWEITPRNEQLISLTSGFDRTKHESLSILVSIL